MEQGRAGFPRDIDPPSDKGQGTLFIKQPMIKTEKLNPVIFLWRIQFQFSVKSLINTFFYCLQVKGSSSKSILIHYAIKMKLE